MARPKKQTVDYFPHFVKSGRTIFILENKYGNDGYAFWFKLLEMLGEADGHYYDCSETTNWEYLLARTKVSEETARDIIKTLIGLGKIDRALWEAHKTIWVQNLVNNLAEVYAKRRVDLPVKPAPEDLGGLSDPEQPEDDKPTQEQTPDGVSDPKTPNKSELSPRKLDKEKESKVKESKEEKYPLQDIVDLWNSSCGNLPKVKLLNQKRRAKMKVRLQEFGKTVEEQRATVTDLFNRVQQSDFLRGDNNHHWTATFDWLFENGENWVKVMEGNYDNNRGRGAAQQTRTQAGTSLGVGEYITEDGRRTYGTGKATIPISAKPRPSERYMWDSQTQDWILQ